MSQAPPTVSLVLLAAVTAPSGGHWNPGEHAGFAPDVAADLIARGAARAWAPTPRPAADQADPKVRGLDVPPAHKMVTGAGTKKKER